MTSEKISISGMGKLGTFNRKRSILTKTSSKSLTENSNSIQKIDKKVELKKDTKTESKNESKTDSKLEKTSVQKVDKKSDKIISSESFSSKGVFTFKSTAEIDVSKGIIDQVIGQDDAVKIIKKAALQRRHVLLIGEPGTGKSMLGLALAELLPKEKLVDIVSFPNPNDENMPFIRTMKGGTARESVYKAKLDASNILRGPNVFMLILLVLALFAPWWALQHYAPIYGNTAAAVIFTAFFLGGMLFLGSFITFMNFNKKANTKILAPKVIVDNFGVKHAPFYDATGAHAGALLGDVLHDPFQSGGLGTPAHERVIAGMIHKAHMGVLFIDEVATLHPTTQQELLTALQEGKFAITGQSERSAGAMVRTEPVPCNFIMIAAGNVDTIKNMHPALRSRIRGYGYEVFMNETIIDTPENRMRVARFVAQEVTKDKKIPHFSPDAVMKIIDESRRMANRKDHLTLRMRELGGVIRAAGDLALEESAELVTAEHILKAKKIARTLEQQIADKYIERKKEYEVIVTKGSRVGRVNGMAVLGSGGAYSGIVLPIEAEVTPGGKEAQVIATGKLGEIAKEAVTNVSAIIKRYFGDSIRNHKDVYVQFLQTYEGVEGDSASIAIAVAIISALKKVPVKQDYAITGSLTVRGEVLPIGGVTYKIEAAIEAGIKHVIVPKSNMKDIVIHSDKLNLVTIIPVERIEDVLKIVIDWKGQEKILSEIIKNKN